MGTSIIVPNRQGGGAPRRLQPGAVKTSYMYYFLQMAIPFTSTAAEVVAAITETKDFDLMVRGATTELLLTNRIQLADQDHDYRLSSGFQPFPIWTGRTDRNEIYQWWRQPYLLDRLSTLTANVLNNSFAPDPAGNLCLISERLGTDRKHQIPNFPICRDFGLTASWTWNGVANSTIAVLTPAVDRDLLIFGSSYNGFAGPNTVQIIDQSRDRLWSTNALRFEYFFGLNGNNQPVLWYPAPYYLPKNTRLQLNVINFGRTVTGATNATPIVVTFSAAHGFQASDLVTIAGVTGNTGANVTNQAITVPSATTISLTGVAGTGAYVSGGVAALGTRTDFVDFQAITLT